VAAGYTIEELEQVLAPMAEDGKERRGLHGRRHAAAVLSSMYRPLSHYFRQNFSQVTNPPIDSLREYRVMSLKTRFGNLKNVLDEDSSQTEILVLESPFVGNAQNSVDGRAVRRRVAFIDCTFAAGGRGRAAQGAGAYPRRGRGCRALGRGASGADR
jgi:glutamate synthase (NADPH) large chain